MPPFDFTLIYIGIAISAFAPAAILLILVILYFCMGKPIWRKVKYAIFPAALCPLLIYSLCFIDPVFDAFEPLRNMLHLHGDDYIGWSCGVPSFVCSLLVIAIFLTVQPSEARSERKKNG